MIPMKHSTVFKSRWMALIWAAGIVWFAYDVASSAPQDDANNATNAEQADDGTQLAADDARKVDQALNSF